MCIVDVASPISHRGVYSSPHSNCPLNLSHHRTDRQTGIKMPRTAIKTNSAPKKPPFLSQGLVVDNMVYCSGQVGADPQTGKLVEGSIKERTVLPPFQGMTHLN